MALFSGNSGTTGMRAETAFIQAQVARASAPNDKDGAKRAISL
jgi:hypothetical protein